MMCAGLDGGKCSGLCGGLDDGSGRGGSCGGVDDGGGDDNDSDLCGGE